MEGRCGREPRFDAATGAELKWVRSELMVKKGWEKKGGRKEEEDFCRMANSSSVERGKERALLAEGVPWGGICGSFAKAL
jgi:hypothetical protein